MYRSKLRNKYLNFGHVELQRGLINTKIYAQLYLEKLKGNIR